MNFGQVGGSIFLGTFQFAILLLISEFLYPGYSVSENYISDLGVGPEPSRTIFTFGVIFFGASILVASYSAMKMKRDLLFASLLFLSGAGAIGVGLFNAIDCPEIHIISAFLAFGFGSLGAIASCRWSKPPYSYISIFLGLLSLAALLLLWSQNLLGLGVGGMERMAAYPLIFWALGFGVYLMHP
jgi:hypothetical membrane protein